MWLYPLNPVDIINPEFLILPFCPKLWINDRERNLYFHSSIDHLHERIQSNGLSRLNINRMIDVVLVNIITLVDLIIGIIWPLCRATPWPPGPSHPPSSQVISAMLPEICFRKHFHFLAFSFSATAAFILSEDTFPLSSFGLSTIRML